MIHRASLERAGLLLVATGLLSLVSVRGYLEDSAPTARDLSLAFGALLGLSLIASARTPPRWARAVALLATTAAFLWGATLVGGADVGVFLVIAAAALAYMLAEPAYRALVVGGFALWTPALQLLAGQRVVDTELVVAAIVALAFLAIVVRRARPASDERLRRIGLALLSIAIVSAVFERHDVVASRVLAPDDVMALLGPLALAALAIAPLPGRIRDAFATGVALAAYVLIGMALILGKPYHVDAVTAPHHAASLLLAGHNPYVDFDMSQALARFGLPQTLATKLEDGTYLHSLNYPAGSFLVVAPFVALGVPDIRWVYLGEMVLFALLLIGRARIPWRPLVAALVVGNTVLTRQYVLAGIDPTWATAVSAAWLFLERRWLSPLALGIAAADRQPAWFFVPFYLVAVWRTAGPREAARRAVLAAAAFAALNLPFFLTAPAAYVGSVLAPLLGPLEPYGVGLVRLGVLGPLPLFPHVVYTVLSLGSLALLLWIVWRWWHALPIAPLTFPLVPLYFAWRSLQNYFVFVPLFAILRDEELVSPYQPAGASLSRQREVEVRAMPVDRELLEILACPVDKQPVREEGDRLVCTKCGRRYPVRDGIPVMLVEEAEAPS